MTTEANAAKALLEKGMKVPATAPSLLRLFGKRQIQLIVPPPHLGTLYRASEIIDESGLDKVLSGAESVTMHQVHKQYIKPISKIVAVSILNYWFVGWLFARPLAMWLRWHVTPLYLFTAARVMDTLRLDESFLKSIRLLAKMKMTTPNLSPEEKGS